MFHLHFILAERLVQAAPPHPKRIAAPREPAALTVTFQMQNLNFHGEGKKNGLIFLLLFFLDKKETEVARLYGLVKIKQIDFFFPPGRRTACGFAFVSDWQRQGCEMTLPLSSCSAFERVHFTPLLVFHAEVSSTGPFCSSDIPGS